MLKPPLQIKEKSVNTDFSISEGAQASLRSTEVDRVLTDQSTADFEVGYNFSATEQLAYRQSIHRSQAEAEREAETSINESLASPLLPRHNDQDHQ